MTMITLLSTALLAALAQALPQASPAPANPAWTLQDDYMAVSPSDFFGRFDFFTQTDPTQGNITYVSQSQAEKENLVGFYPTSNPSASTGLMQTQQGQTSNWAAYMGVDMTTPQKAMRDSVRISSKKQYNAPMLTVVSVDHLPLGLGTWPAFWLLGQGTWPAGGEIDIIESFGTPANGAKSGSDANAAAAGQAPASYGAKVQGTPQSPNANSMTLHASSGCALSNNGSGSAFQGTLLQQNCDTYATPGNQGCQIKSPFGTVSGVTPGHNQKRQAPPVPEHQFATGGPAFNTQGGGVYATAWTAQGVNIWFFPPNAVPASLQGNGTNPNTAEFGTPLASFVGSGCDWTEHFKGMNIIFNIALCGQAISDKTWTSDGRGQASGKGSCNDYVYGNQGLQESWWGVRGLRVYGQ
ncbi:MAG: hypothetical protein Q9159_001683 [Coniocarpon cinnabarinum]